LAAIRAGEISPTSSTAGEPATAAEFDMNASPENQNQKMGPLTSPKRGRERILKLAGRLAVASSKQRKKTVKTLTN
jgi:hypothetical protein